MKIPKRLKPLVEDGIVDEIIRPLMSGKEAAVYLVRAEGEICCAKVYKDSKSRSFRQRSEYQEGRKVRNSRRARAMDKRSSYGKKELEDAWQNSEVDALYKLSYAGVRVPKPSLFVGGVLLMELIADEDGNPASRLVDLDFSPEEATAMHALLIREVVRMLVAGLVHGDLSEYNVLISPEGPVIIDLPQAVDAAGNNNAPRILRRDVDNLSAYLGKFAPALKLTDYAREIWDLFEKGKLHPDTELTGKFKQKVKDADVGGIMREITAARMDAERRLGVELGSRDEAGEKKPRAVIDEMDWTAPPPTSGFREVVVTDFATPKAKGKNRRRELKGGHDFRNLDTFVSDQPAAKPKRERRPRGDRNAPRDAGRGRGDSDSAPRNDGGAPRDGGFSSSPRDGRRGDRSGAPPPSRAGGRGRGFGSPRNGPSDDARPTDRSSDSGRGRGFGSPRNGPSDDGHRGDNRDNRDNSRGRGFGSPRNGPSDDGHRGDGRDNRDNSRGRGFGSPRNGPSDDGHRGDNRDNRDNSRGRGFGSPRNGPSNDGHRGDGRDNSRGRGFGSPRNGPSNDSRDRDRNDARGRGLDAPRSGPSDRAPGASRPPRDGAGRSYRPNDPYSSDYRSDRGGRSGPQDAPQAHAGGGRDYRPNDPYSSDYRSDRGDRGDRGDRNDRGPRPQGDRPPRQRRRHGGDGPSGPGFKSRPYRPDGPDQSQRPSSARSNEHSASAHPGDNAPRKQRSRGRRGGRSGGGGGGTSQD